MAAETNAAKPGKNRATITDVAVGAKVSQSTASRVMTGHGYVAQPVRARVLKVVAELGYVPHEMARNLKKQVSKSIGVLVSDLRNSFYSNLAAGVSKASRDSGYTMMLTDLGNNSVGEVEAAEAFVAMRVAGVIVTPVSAAITDYLGRYKIPVVEVDRQFAPDVCDAVVVDNRGAARAMTEHLLSLGHRRIALLVDESKLTTGRDRYAGYREAMDAYGVQIDPVLVVSSGWDVDVARASARALLTGPSRPTALFAGNNLLAEGAWRAASDLGMRVPGDLSLVSFDDAPWMSMVVPRLTTVSQDAVALGTAAVERLVARFHDVGGEPRTVVLSAPLLIRDSTGSPLTVPQSRGAAEERTGWRAR